MSTTKRTMRCSPEDVFDVLSDGWSYVNWVVGAARVRDVDDDFPAAGTKIHHSVGAWPLMISDDTQVEHVDAPREIQLRVRAWPTGEGRVNVTVDRTGEGCEVTMVETAESGPAKLIPQILLDLLLRPRNNETLRRLAFLAERASARPR